VIKSVYFWACLVFGGLMALVPWFGVPCVAFAVLLFLDQYQMKVKVRVEGEALARLLELEKKVNSMAVSTTFNRGLR
jgi:hypothetical protein